MSTHIAVFLCSIRSRHGRTPNSELHIFVNIVAFLGRLPKVDLIILEGEKSPSVREYSRTLKRIFVILREWKYVSMYALTCTLLLTYPTQTPLLFSGSRLDRQ